MDSRVSNKVMQIVIPRMVEFYGIPRTSFNLHFRELGPNNPAVSGCHWNHHNEVTGAFIKLDLKQIECPFRLAGILAHEITHIKQYIKKEITPGLSNTRYYKGASYKVSSREEGRSFFEYLTYPWEVEARGMEPVGKYFLEHSPRWKDFAVSYNLPLRESTK